MSLIKPYIGSWLTLYSDSKHIGQMIIILSKLTTLPKTGYPNPPLCEEAWCFFHPVLDLVRNECKGQQLAVDDHSHALKFFSNLCCDAEHGVEVFECVNEFLDEWLSSLTGCGPQCLEHWGSLIASFSTIPALIPKISPKMLDHALTSLYRHMYRSRPRGKYYTKIVDPICQSVARTELSKYLLSLPPVHMIPRIVTSKQQIVDSGMDTFIEISFPLCIVYTLREFNYYAENGIENHFHDIISGEKCQLKLLSPSGCDHDKVGEYDIHRPIDVCQHLVRMSFSNERTFRQRTYHFLEETAMCVEIYFNFK
ncbi:hypothetical protein ADUPG1_010128 [Aduncisulcus paluster]|uniref:Uncharacterized protein n=1 Tax=Aduncisulcus paluster TaxID=2918883 RepID=A0ABQ5L0J5_9EUKA|nr:hypothetical protein ADUPG1_010128 [Aduncisulcus paluster]